MTPHSDLRCRFCGTALDGYVVNADERICSATACRMKRGAELARLVQARHRAHHIEATREAVLTLAPAIAALDRADDGKPPPVALLPRRVGALRPSDPDAVAAFTAALDEAIAEAFAPDAEPDTTRSVRDTEAPPEPFAAACCTACEGNCCRQGRARDAFIDAETIRRYRDCHPGIAPAAVREAYLSRIPKRAAPDSCVFHAPRGCTLDRRQRSSVCNDFQCRMLRYAISAKGGASCQRSALLAQAEDGTNTLRVFHAGTGLVTVRTAMLAPPVTTSEGEALAAAVADALEVALPAPPTSDPVLQDGPTCTICGNGITRHQAVRHGICDDPSCKGARIRHLATRRA